MSWAIAGTYFESCNCDAICPCRRIDGTAGGRSTHGICEGVLTWRIETGEHEGVVLSGLPVAMATRYDDDEPGSPWTWLLYVDEAATAEQSSALLEIFSGRSGGDALTHFPWAWKASEFVALVPARIELDHTQRRQRVRVRDVVRVTVRGAYGVTSAVSCVIPGHDRDGEELVMDELVVTEPALAEGVHYEGVCGYAATFDYRG